MTRKYNFVFGLANDLIGYIIPEEEWDWNGTWIDGEWTGKYEESMSLGPSAAVIIEGTLMKMLSSITGYGKSFQLYNNIWHQGNASIYVAGMISFKVDGYQYNPYVPWWYVEPRPESWTTAWIQWNITSVYIGLNGEWGYYKGYNDQYGQIILVYFDGKIWMFGSTTHFNGNITNN